MHRFRTVSGWFTIPKRLRIYFRYDRKLLGMLCRAAWVTVRDLYALEVDGDCGTPAMIGTVQTFGDLINYHPHIHAVAPEGVFTESGYFVHIPETWKHRAVEIWQEKVCTFLVGEGRIDQEVAAMIKNLRSGFRGTMKFLTRLTFLPQLRNTSPIKESTRFDITGGTRISGGA